MTARCGCGSMKVVGPKGECVCFVCHGQVIDAKNELIRENWSLLTRIAKLEADHAELAKRLEQCKMGAVDSKDAWKQSGDFVL